MTEIASTTIYSRLKHMLGRIKNIPPKEIKADHTLRGDLKFSEQGVRGLAVHINTEFSDLNVKVTPEETAEAKTVRDLHQLIMEKIKEDAE